jgi:hypothetical protein
MTFPIGSLYKMSSFTLTVSYLPEYMQPAFKDNRITSHLAVGHLFNNLAHFNHYQIFPLETSSQNLFLNSKFHLNLVKHL